MVSASTRLLPSTTICDADWARACCAVPTLAANVQKRTPPRTALATASPRIPRTQRRMRSAPYSLLPLTGPRLRNRLYRVCAAVQTVSTPAFAFSFLKLQDSYTVPSSLGFPQRFPQEDRKCDGASHAETITNIPTSAKPIRNPNSCTRSDSG